MACRGAPNFEDYIRERLGPRSEAGKMIADLAKDTSVSNAIAMTIEALSTSKSRELRHLVDSFQLYCDWVEDWEPRGWSIELSGSWVMLLAPPGRRWEEIHASRKNHPSNNVVAAAAGASSVSFDDYDDTGNRVEITFRITR